MSNNYAPEDNIAPTVPGIKAVKLESLNAV